MTELDELLDEMGRNAIRDQVCERLIAALRYYRSEMFLHLTGNDDADELDRIGLAILRGKKP